MVRILCLSNFYPPLGKGGYEQWCQEVSEGLAQRGHTVTVLTSRHQCEHLGSSEPEWIHRHLYLEMELASLRNGLSFFTQRKHREQENLACLLHLIIDQSPDVVLVWGMWNLSRALAAVAEAMLPGRVVYYMGDYWPTLPSQYRFYWQAPARNWLTRLPKAILGRLAAYRLDKEKLPTLHFGHVLFPTAFMCGDFLQRGLDPQHAQVIYGAVNTKPYSHVVRPPRIHTTLNLLYAGRLSPEKGVHTALEAISILVNQHQLTQLHLTVAGGGDPEYVKRLHQIVRQERLEQFITFLGAQPAEAMPALYSTADVLLFTSIWNEPFGRVLVEAMAAGVIVVGTATGGASEILMDGENALLFPPEDAGELATQITRLAEAPELRQHLAARARQIAVEKFDTCRMVDEIEAYLQKVVAGP